MKPLPLLLSGLLMLITFAAGYLTGRRTIPYEESVKYVKAPTYHIEIPLPVPKKESLIGPMQFAPLLSGDATPADATVRDWNTHRDYTETLLDNEYGRLTVDATIQYNQLQALHTTFTPIQKEITRTRDRHIQPYATLSYITSGYSGIGLGLFLRRWGIEYQYQRKLPIAPAELKKAVHQISLKYRF